MQVLIRFLLLFLCTLSALPAHAQVSDTREAWTTLNIGTPLLGGGSTPLACTAAQCPAVAVYTSAAGWGSADELTFVHKPLPGDGAVVALVDDASTATGVTGTGAGGVGIRNGLEPTAASFSLVVSAAGELVIQSRAAAKGALSTRRFGAVSSPIWLKVERRGTAVTAFRSADGSRWTVVGTGTLPAMATAQAGLVAASENSNLMLGVTASNLRTEYLSSLPPGWSATEVGGSAAGPGNVSLVSGVHLISNTGGSIGGTADRFGFAHVRVSGDAELTARIIVPGKASVSKGGVMLRASLNANAAYAMAGLITPSTRVTEQRVSTGVVAKASSTKAVGSVWWLRIVRTGSIVTTFESADGVRWTSIGSVTMVLPSTVYVGLAFAAGAGATGQGVFDQVSLRAVPANKAPTAALTAPTASSSIRAGDNVSLVATAADADGTIGVVEFFVNGTKVSTDATSPYQGTWAGAKAGTHVLSAVAVDSEGTRTTSKLVTVTVAAAVSGGTSTPSTPSSPTPSSPTPSSPTPTSPTPTSPTPSSPTPTSPTPTSPTPTSPTPTSPTPTSPTPTSPTPTSPTPSLPLPSIPLPLPGLGGSWILQFNPSADHFGGVTRYVLEVFTAGKLLAVTLDLGRPSVVGGICTVDISGTLAGLLAGLYTASVRAVDDRTGISSPAATATFTR